MKCFVIVDAQNDFLPKGSFNSRDDYMNALNKINAIRLRLHNCTEKDLMKLNTCKHMMQYQPDKLLKENIVQYHQCSNDIDDEQREGDILLFPWNDRVMTSCSNGLSALNGCNGLHKQPTQGTVNGVEGMPNGHHSDFSHTPEDIARNDTHMYNHHPSESHPKLEENKVALLNGTKESTNEATAKFAVNILSVDYHPQYHISFAETHRIVFEQINKNRGIKNSSVKKNGHGLPQVSSHDQVNRVAIFEEEDEGVRPDEAEYHDEGVLDEGHGDGPDGEVQPTQQTDLLQAAFLKKHKIFNLSDVMKNIANIKSTKYIYKNVNSVSDIKDYSKLNFLNESIDVWPVHCVRNTSGCKIHPSLIRHMNDIVIKKADTENHDSHTIFENREINEKILKLLKGLNVKSVYICGFIFEYCVKETALSFLNLGFDTYIVEDATAY
ncbi:pyrazinamidase/nicotinamidase, partial [Plasmodium cynomolgi strain B]